MQTIMKTSLTVLISFWCLSPVTSVHIGSQEPLDGRNHNTFTWKPETTTWQFLMQNKDKTGKWAVFAEDNLRKP
jgi:hypothetical protein